MPSRVSAQRLSGAQHHVGAPRAVVVALGDEGVERVLTGVAARAVTAVVAEGDGVGQGDVDPDAAGDRGGDLGDLQGVGQPGALVVGGVDHHLGLAGQPAEGGGVHDPVPVALEAGPLGVRLLGPARFPAPSARVAPGRSVLALPLLAQLPADHRPGPGTGARVGVGADHGRRPDAGHGLRPTAAARAAIDRPSATRDAQLGVGQVEVAARRCRRASPRAARPWSRGAPCRPAGQAELGVRERHVRVELGQQRVELGEAERSWPARAGARRRPGSP